MVREKLDAVIAWITRVVTEPRSELTRWQRSVRFAYDLGRLGAEQLHKDRAAQMAAALAYHTLFALLPVIIVVTMMLHALKPKEMDGWVQKALESLKLYEIQIASESPTTEAPSTDTKSTETVSSETVPSETVPSETVSSETVPSETVPSEIVPSKETVGGESVETETLGHWIEELVKKSGKLDLDTLQFVGVLVVIYSALSLMVTIENCFNLIFRAPGGRSWMRRIPLYWTVLTLSPLAIFGMLYLDSVFAGWILEVAGSWTWVLVSTNILWSFLITWVLILTVYTLVPNTEVEFKPALAGAFVAALALEIGKRSLGAYFANAFTFSQLYGSLGSIPVFILWVYLMWLVILFGLEVGATFQRLGGRRPEDLDRRARPMRTGLVDPSVLIVVMGAIAERFREGHSSSPHEISQATGIDENQLELILEPLVQKGLLHRVSSSDHVALGRPPESIEASELLVLAYNIVDRTRGHLVPAVFQRLREAQYREVSGLDLSTLVSMRKPEAV